MEITWQDIVLIIIILIGASFIAGIIDVAWHDRKRRRDKAEREKLERRGNQ